MSEKDDKRVSRRQLLTFWRRAADELSEQPKAALGPQSPTAKIAPRAMWPLRPPGASGERHLLDTCTQCGNCISECPAGCILPLPASFGVAAGTPAINPVSMPCVLCDNLKCTHVCPSGALKPLTENAQVKMGLARVDESTCVTYLGQSCPSCFLACPVPEAIYRDDQGRIHVGQTCTGCGLCEHVCPVAPKAIVVVPTGFVA